MTAVTQSLKTQLEQLSSEERAELASYLLDSLTAEEDPDAEAAWDTELTRRCQEIERGDATGEPAASVFARLRARYT